MPNAPGPVRGGPGQRPAARSRLAATLGRLIPGIVAEAYRRRGFVEPALLRMRSIVGEETADRAVPVKIAFPRGSRTAGTLHVRVEGAYATELQHNAPRIVERLNGFYGYAAIARLALHQGPVERRAAARASSRPTAGEAPPVGGIESPKLRERSGGASIRSDPESGSR